MKLELRRHGTSIVLALIAVVLGVWLWVDRGTITDAERGKRPKNVLPAFRRDEVSRIEITKGAEKLVIVRDVDRDADASWRVESPEPGPADPNAVEQLSSAFEFATFVRKVDAKASPTFDAPRATGVVVMGKITYRFALGGAAPTPEGASYFKLEGDAVYVVTKELTEQLLKGAAAYKSRTIVPYLSLDLSSLEIRGKTTVRLERTGDLTFKIAGSGLRASREALDKLWSAFAEMRAESFTTEAVGEPAFTITMTPKDGRPRGELVVGGPCKDHPDDLVVSRKSPTRLDTCAPKGITEGLSLTEADLADARLFFAHEDELEELTLSNDTDKIELARKGSSWHARAPFDRDLVGDEVDAANALASAVVRAKGTSVVPFVAGDFTVRSHIRLRGGEMKDDENVDVGQNAKGEWSAHRISDNARIALADEVARRLRPSKSALKGRDVIQPALDPKDVVALSLRCGVAQDLSRDGTQPWKMKSPTGYTADQAATLDLVDQIAHLRADAWIADTDDGSFGFATSTCTVTLTARSGRAVTLRIGRDAENGIYAIASEPAGSTPVFLEPRGFRDALARILVDRSALGIEASKATSIVLSRGGARVELKRSGDRLTTDAGLPVSVESITSALDALRADDVVRVGPPAPDEGFGQPSLEIRAGTTHIRFGRDGLRKNQAIVFARIDGVDATFAVARERVDPIRSAL